MNKFKMLGVVHLSALTNQQKQLLCFLILKGDEDGVSWHPVSTLCKVAGIAHEKNFKGVTHYLPGLVTIEKVVSKNGKHNRYTLCTPAVEGLLPAEVVLKETSRRGTAPSLEGVHKTTTPAVEGDPTPAPEGTCTPAVEGTNSTKNTTTKEYKEKQHTPQATSLFESKVEDEVDVSRLERVETEANAFIFELNSKAPGLSRKELSEVYDLTNDKPWGRLPLKEAAARVYESRGKGFDEW